MSGGSLACFMRRVYIHDNEVADELISADVTDPQALWLTMCARQDMHIPC